MLLLFFLCFCFSIFYTMIAEYLAHRVAMHSLFFGKTKFWYAHAVQHHAQHRNDVNIELPPIHSLILGIPLFIFCIWLGWLWFFTVIILAFLHASTWTILHSTYHGVGHFSWVKRWWYYKLWERHHLLHHDHPRKNYGAVFIWTDYLFGTKL